MDEIVQQVKRGLKYILHMAKRRKSRYGTAGGNPA